MEKVYHYTVIFEKEDIGYHVYCPALVGCHSQGDTYTVSRDLELREGEQAC